MLLMKWETVCLCLFYPTVNFEDYSNMESFLRGSKVNDKIESIINITTIYIDTYNILQKENRIKQKVKFDFLKTDARKSTFKQKQTLIFCSQNNHNCLPLKGS